MTDAFEAPERSFAIEGDHIRVNPADKAPGKISGTMMGAILGCSPFNTPFRVACDLLGICREDISNKPAVVAGKTLEPKVIEFAQKTWGEMGSFVPAEEVFGARDGPHNEWAPDFDNPVFTGHLDGAVVDSDGRTRVLEIKTTGNMAPWREGVPLHYRKQVELYNHYVTHRDEAVVVVAYVDDEGRRDPESYELTEDNTFLFRMPVDEDEVEADLAKARDWYETYILQGVTPDYDPNDPRDVEMYMHLLNMTLDEDSVPALLSKYLDVVDRIDQLSLEMKPLTEAADELKDRIKDYMTTKGVTELECDAGRAVVTERTRTTIDARLLRADGIDPSKYETKTISKAITFKRC